MANVFGPKLGLLFNANINEYYADNFRKFLQALDQLIMGNVINSTTVVPPTSPSPGDAYLISSTPSGLWAGFPVNSIAVWDTQVTLSGTNTQAPAWVNYIPNPGWTIWNVAAATYLVFNGSAWIAVGGGANFPTNTDITSLTGIPNTLINSTGYDLGTPATGTGLVVTDTELTYGVTGETGIGVSVGCGLPGLTGGGIICYTSGGASGMDSTGFKGGTLVLTGGADLHNGAILINTLESADPGTLTYTPTWSSAQPTIGFLINGVTSTSLKCLLGFENYPTQTTVGAAGGASTLPVTPTGYLQVEINGTPMVIPYYAQA